MTGAVMPVGADTVVAHEQASSGQECIQFDGSALRAGANRRLRGEDLGKALWRCRQASASHQPPWACWPVWDWARSACDAASAWLTSPPATSC
jgi:hypothetical protein